ncbi:MAG: hypothetical protein R3310_07020 [Candidatus Competibacteraceae bacterium]|nr:hypothetical protein [Candidatus Competibacteraceae bacterium]
MISRLLLLIILIALTGCASQNSYYLPHDDQQVQYRPHGWQSK